MEQLIELSMAFARMYSQIDVVIAILVGTCVGLLLGAIPGLTSTVGIVLLIPFTFYMSPLAAISMVYAVHKGGTYGGSIPAILLNTPGTPAAACTQQDGYPLTQQGKQGKALKTAVVASAIGDFLSDLVLIFATVYIANLVWAFGPVEIAAVLFFAITIIGTVAGKSVTKGLISAFVGLLLATVGLDPMGGTPRLAFGLVEFQKGFDLVALLVGIFIFSEVLVQLETAIIRQNIRETHVTKRKLKAEDQKLTLKEFRAILPTIFRSYTIGQIIGVIPGIGAAITPWVSYGQAKSFSKHPEEYGKGSLEGIAAAEAANNAVCGANMMPLLTLGIPGSTDAALIMGVFLIHGYQFGPMIFQEQPHLVYGVFAAGLIAIFLYFILGYFLAERIGRIIRFFPAQIIYPLVLITSFLGAYAGNSSLFDTGAMVVFGVLGYGMRKNGFSLPALVIAFMLGYKFEFNLRQALRISDGDFLIFLTSPISLICILFALGLTVYTFKKRSMETE